ncbi:LacI family DNA-binding transcriptional regulator [Arthrobacter oryzae]|jgi:DNA-binding LacI/PurR family transcriptional regulator|uniref:LacI family DNA-binding transcriptional regulator n=1 Tax=Arthrobacter oryzae TaxID=409290 RepID=UPI0027865867|nr:LacI family DNA-binding transcriptional regulator [Arthrobacter oryzae]MDQ0077721.1 DNA-binding LacI/PurR family transcriptional regulator [Arthrobacter oryzae]
MAATLHDVARVAGVSFKTVSNVINNHPHVRDSTRARVEEAIAALGYRPNLTARSLRSGHTGAITLALPQLSLPYFAELADSVIEAAAKHGLVVLIEQTGADRGRELEVMASPRLKMSDGLIFSPLELGQEDVDLIKAEVPIVLLGERIFNSQSDHVTMQNVAAARAATEHLLSLGRTRIAVVGAHQGEVIGSAGLRLRGYREALAARNIPYDDGIVAYVRDWHRSNGAAAMHDLLDRGATFDAVFGLNDTLAQGAVRVLQEAGFRVPDDVAVIGFDDLDETRYSLPTLSTVDPGRGEIAETAIRLLMERIKNPDAGPPREVESAFRIVPRESTVGGQAPPRVRD